MNTLASLLVAAFVACVILAQGVAPKGNVGGLTFGEFTISRSGLLSLVGKPSQYMIVPQDRFPAELRGLAVVDLRHGVYVARFFEPAGTGVESFFDVCFQIRSGNVFSRTIDNTAGLERIDSAVIARSCTYIFDTEKRSLLRIECENAKSSEISLLGPLKTLPDSDVK